MLHAAAVASLVPYLALVVLLVLGGSIAVESRLSKGTAFTITLPLSGK